MTDTVNPTEFVTPDGTVLVAKDDESEQGCEGCVFQSPHDKAHGTSCKQAPCCTHHRTDTRSIIWVVKPCVTTSTTPTRSR